MSHHGNSDFYLETLFFQRIIISFRPPYINMYADLTSQDALSIVILIILGLYSNSLRNRHKTLKVALLPPNYSPWRRLLNFGDDKSFLDMTGFNRYTFLRLEEAIYSDILPDKRGNPSTLNRRDQLGLYLIYLSSRMQIKYLCAIFGAPPSCVSRYINDMMKLICKKLKNNVDARIQFPDQVKMAYYASLVQIREPLINNVIGFVDGLSIHVECSSYQSEQSAAYNGHTKDTMCNNVLAFSPTGKIISACLNFPGSWHDSTVCSALIDHVIQNIGTYALCVDQGFPRSGDLFDKFVGPISKRHRRMIAPILRNDIMRRIEIYVSLRQASEWGMRALQGTFSRLKSRLTSNKTKRLLILLSVVLLHNFRTEYIGLNQIATVFNPEYEQYINFDGYDRIANYFQL